MSTIEKKIIHAGKEYFDSLVRSGVEARGISVSSSVINYLAKMLSFYVDARNLHEPEFDESGRRIPQTLAELWLTAQNSDSVTQKELLRKLGDRTLYIAGFFSESLSRSLVDIDYYYSMGTSAYRTLAHTSDQNSSSVFEEISYRFMDLVTVFKFISHDTIVKSDKEILKLYETFLRTGSAHAKEKLESLGVFGSWTTNPKKHNGH